MSKFIEEFYYGNIDPKALSRINRLITNGKYTDAVETES